MTNWTERLLEAIDRLTSHGDSPNGPGHRLILTVDIDELERLAAEARTLILTVDIDELERLAAEARTALAQPEPQRLTVQECNDMRKHGENYIYESRDGKEIQLDGYFTREDLIELANTQPTTH